MEQEGQKQKNIITEQFPFFLLSQPEKPFQIRLLEIRGPIRAAPSEQHRAAVPPPRNPLPDLDSHIRFAFTRFLGHREQTEVFPHCLFEQIHPTDCQPIYSAVHCLAYRTRVDRHFEEQSLVSSNGGNLVFVSTGNDVTLRFCTVIISLLG